MARNRSELVTIFWRDIPAQVNAQVGRTRHQVVLPARFQRVFVNATATAEIYTAEEDVAQWRRETRSLTDKPESATSAAVSDIETTYTPERLRDLARAAGHNPSREEHEPHGAKPEGEQKNMGRTARSQKAKRTT